MYWCIDHGSFSRTTCEEQWSMKVIHRFHKHCIGRPQQCGFVSVQNTNGPYKFTKLPKSCSTPCPTLAVCSRMISILCRRYRVSKYLRGTVGSPDLHICICRCRCLHVVWPGHAWAWCSDLSSGHTRERAITSCASWENTPWSIPPSGQWMQVHMYT